MKKMLLMMITFQLIAYMGSAQTTRPVIKKSLKDPKNTERAARADVYISKKKQQNDIGPYLRSRAFKTAPLKERSPNNWFP